MKNDFISECLSDITNKIKRSVPIDQFSSEFCLYCINKDCSRASVLSFDKRTQNWERDLFLNVKRDNGDPKFDSIREKWARYTPNVKTEENEQVIIKEETIQSVQDTTAQISKTEERPQEQLELNFAEQNESSVTDNLDLKNQEQPEQIVNPHSQNTQWDQPAFVSGSSSDEVVIQPGGSFTFGS